MKNEAISSQKLIHLRKQRLSFVHLHELNLERSAEKSFWKACCICSPIIPILASLPQHTTTVQPITLPRLRVDHKGVLQGFLSTFKNRQFKALDIDLQIILGEN